MIRVLVLAALLASPAFAQETGPHCGPPEQVAAELTQIFMRFDGAVRVADGIVAETWSVADGSIIAHVLRLSDSGGTRLCVTSVSRITHGEAPQKQGDGI